MRSIVFQDVFSNLFLGIFVLMVLTLRLSGPPPEPARIAKACEFQQGPQSRQLATIFATAHPNAPPGEVIWAKLASEILQQKPPVPTTKGGAFISITRDGCVGACYRCEADPGNAYLQSSNGAISVVGCKVTRCTEDRP